MSSNSNPSISLHPALMKAMRDVIHESSDIRMHLRAIKSGKANNVISLQNMKHLGCSPAE